ncbi:hypothetical protein [Sphingobium sp. CECT 9361]|nr:hypothetical protein [Sphingobium sp. CECT 9361]CAH0356504.1 hypothetical protein SPH9361_04144 [Sphingobium sp. CECT 9361]
MPAVDEITAIGGEDLSDADAFLNRIYQKKVKPSVKCLSCRP